MKEATMAYSKDLRWKIVQAYENGEGSMREMAKRFSVSLGFVLNLISVYRETNEVACEKPPGRRNLFKEAGGFEKLQELYLEKNDLTDSEYRDLLEERFGIKTSRQTVNRAFNALKLTKKKNTSRL